MGFSYIQHNNTIVILACTIYTKCPPTPPTKIISNLFLKFFIKLTWHFSSYSHIPIHYNHEIINIIKIQSSPLWSFCFRPSFWVL
jgi:hypothetical protein